MTEKAKRSRTRGFTVPEVWRAIVKKNERQGGGRFDVLVCSHAVPANDNTYRRARSCPECRLKVQQYADSLPGSDRTTQPAAASAAAPKTGVRVPRAKAGRTVVRRSARPRSTAHAAR